MSSIKDNISKAYQWAIANRPKVNGYPYLAEALRQVEVNRYVYSLPSCQCIFFSSQGNVVTQMDAIKVGMCDVPRFDEDALIKQLRISQEGESTFPEFLRGAWEAGVVSYEADLQERKVTYYGAQGESYVEKYPFVEVQL